MSSAFGGRRHRRRPSINITSLIDVMFLLLIFFMVSSTFREHFGIDITLPAAQTATEQEPANYEITVTSKGEFFFGEQLVDAQGLRSSILELLTREPDAVLVLRADETADFGMAIQAIDIAREAGGSKLIIPTRFQKPDAQESVVE